MGQMEGKTSRFPKGLLRFWKVGRQTVHYPVREKVCDKFRGTYCVLPSNLPFLLSGIEIISLIFLRSFGFLTNQVVPFSLPFSGGRVIGWKGGWL